jgi:hypothetical protein
VGTTGVSAKSREIVIIPLPVPLWICSLAVLLLLLLLEMDLAKLLVVLEMPACNLFLWSSNRSRELYG